MKHPLWLRLVASTMVVATAVASSACASKTINHVLADQFRYRDPVGKLSG